MIERAARPLGAAGEPARHADPFAGSGAKSVRHSFDQPGATLGHLFQRQLVLGGNDAVTQPYLEDIWVHVCLSLISEMASAVPIKLRAGPEGDAEEIESSPLLDLLSAPNSFMEGEGLLTEALVIDYLHDGEQFWFLTGPGGKAWSGNALPDQINTVRGKLVESPREEDIERIGPTIRIKAWRTASAGEQVVFPAESVVQIRRANPYSPIRGTGLVTALMRSIQNNFTAQRYDDAILKNGGQGNLAFISDGPITPAQLKESRARYREQHSDAQRHGEPYFLPHGVKAQTLSLSPRDMEFQVLRTWYRDQILAGFRVPLVLLGREVEGGFSRAGQKEARLAFHEDVVGPLLRTLERQINAGFVARLPEPYRSQRLVFDDSAVRAESLDALSERFSKLTTAGVPMGTAARMAGWELPPEIESELDEVEERKQEQADALREQAAAPQDGSKEGGQAEEEQSIPRHVCHALDDALIPADKRMASLFQRAFEDFTDELIDNIREKALAPGANTYQVPVDTIGHTFSDEQLEDLFGELAPWRTRLADEIDPEIARVFVEQSEALLAELGIVPDLTDPLSARHPAVTAHLAAKELRIVETLDTLRNDLKRTIVKVLDEQGTTTDLATALRESLESLESQLADVRMNLGARARLIARTETTSAANAARVTTMSENGVEEHRWKSADPSEIQEDTRARHAQLHDVKRKVGEEFLPGLRYPGDTNAPVGEVANCRCFTQPVVPEIPA